MPGRTSPCTSALPSSIGPFDAIVITAAIGHAPQPLIDQLKVGGRIVLPLGSVSGGQQLTVIEKTARDKTVSRSVIAVRFVPFTGPQDRK